MADLTSLGHPVDFDPTTYGNLNPDLQTYYDTNKTELDAYYGSKEGFLSNHYLMAGATEGREYKEGSAAGGGEEGGGWSGYAQNVMGILAGYKNPIGAETAALAKEQISYTSRRLTEIEQARKLGDMTGTLTSDEKRMFQEMEDSAVANLKSQVNAQTQDVWNTALSDLVNRGVLQGTVGERILGVISSENVRTVAEGANTIRGTTNANILNVQEANKDRALTWDQMLSRESLGLLGVGQGYANAALQAQTQNAALGVNANVALAGLSSQESIAGGNRALTEALAKLQSQTQWNIANLDAQTKLGMAAGYQNAATTASQYGLYGNLTAAGLGYASKVDWTKWWNSLNSGSGSTTTTDPYGYTVDPNSPGYYGDAS